MVNLSNISHATRKIITESKYLIKFVKNLEEAVHFDPSDDATNLKLGENGPAL